jgi:hypothetical protein
MEDIGIARWRDGAASAAFAKMIALRVVTMRPVDAADRFSHSAVGILA